MLQPMHAIHPAMNRFHIILSVTRRVKKAKPYAPPTREPHLKSTAYPKRSNSHEVSFLPSLKLAVDRQHSNVEASQAKTDLRRDH